MQDRFGRAVGYLRLSVTRACESQCLYCRPETLPVGDSEPILSPLEIESLVGHLVRRHGIAKVRLTGGEPTSRPDLLEIIQRLGKIEGLGELAMTTNGLTLAKEARSLKQAGLTRVNISLDSLDAEKYQRMTGVDGLLAALRGIDAALAAGLTPVKLNTVVIRGENEYEIENLLLYAVDRGVEIRFIELMPMGPLAGQWERRYVPETEMRQRLSDVVTTWRPAVPGNAAARRYRVGLPYGRRGVVGFITAMSCPFCDTCNRIRIGADGTYYPCLMDKPAGTLLAALRPTFDPQALDQLLEEGLGWKQREHPPTGTAVMTQIGG